MSPVWRFYQDHNGHWRWQHIGADQEVVAHSSGAFREYAHCVESAGDHGYVFVPPQPNAGHGAMRPESDMAY